MATKNAIIEKSIDLTIDPGAAGDSFVQFDINTTGEFRIGVDDTDDSFRISQGSALGTSDTFVMTSSGERTMPLQPAFLANNTVTDSDVTGDGTVVTPVEFNNEVFDQGGNYNDGTDTFTAPVTGKYLLSVDMYLLNFNGTQTSVQVDIVTTGGTFTIWYSDPTNIHDGGDFSVSGTVFTNMTATDTATVSVVSSGGDKVVDIRGSAGDRRTSFSGVLIV